MCRFQGVATKYLPNHLGWQRMVDRHGDGPPPLLVLSAALA
jgi:hypothetical protein